MTKYSYVVEFSFKANPLAAHVVAGGPAHLPPIIGDRVARVLCSNRRLCEGRGGEGGSSLKESESLAGELKTWGAPRRSTLTHYDNEIQLFNWSASVGSARQARMQHFSFLSNDL